MILGKLTSQGWMFRFTSWRMFCPRANGWKLQWSSDLFPELNINKVSNIRILWETMYFLLHEFYNTVHDNEEKTSVTEVFHMTEPLVINRSIVFL